MRAVAELTTSSVTCSDLSRPSRRDRFLWWRISPSIFQSGCPHRIHSVSSFWISTYQDCTQTVCHHFRPRWEKMKCLEMS